MRRFGVVRVIVRQHGGFGCCRAGHLARFVLNGAVSRLAVFDPKRSFL